MRTGLWIVEKYGKDRDGKAKKRRHFEDVPAGTPGARHRADKEKKKFTVTPSYILCWIAILMLQGAHFGEDKGIAANIWKKAPEGVSIPYIQTP